MENLARLTEECKTLLQKKKALEEMVTSLRDDVAPGKDESEEAMYF